MATQLLHAPAVDREHALLLQHEMLRIRRFEETCAELYMAARVRGLVHLYVGEEAIAVGVMQALAPDDRVVATYRKHGHALARGVPSDCCMAEMFDSALDLRDQLDIDSMDFLNLVIGVHQALGVDIPEADYPRLVTLDGFVTYLVARRDVK